MFGVTRVLVSKSSYLGTGDLVTLIDYGDFCDTTQCRIVSNVCRIRKLGKGRAVMRKIFIGIVLVEASREKKPPRPTKRFMNHRWQFFQSPVHRKRKAQFQRRKHRGLYVVVNLDDFSIGNQCFAFNEPGSGS